MKNGHSPWWSAVYCTPPRTALENATPEKLSRKKMKPEFEWRRRSGFDIVDFPVRPEQASRMTGVLSVVGVLVIVDLVFEFPCLVHLVE